MDYSQDLSNLLRNLRNNSSQTPKSEAPKNEEVKETEKELLSKEEKNINNGEMKTDDLYGGMAELNHTKENVQKQNNSEIKTPEENTTENNQKNINEANNQAQNAQLSNLLKSLKSPKSNNNIQSKINNPEFQNETVEDSSEKSASSKTDKKDTKNQFQTQIKNDSLGNLLKKLSTKPAVGKTLNVYSARAAAAVNTVSEENNEIPSDESTPNEIIKQENTQEIQDKNEVQEQNTDNKTQETNIEEENNNSEIKEQKSENEVQDNSKTKKTEEENKGTAPSAQDSSAKIQDSKIEEQSDDNQNEDNQNPDDNPQQDTHSNSQNNQNLEENTKESEQINEVSSADEIQTAVGSSEITENETPNEEQSPVSETSADTTQAPAADETPVNEVSDEDDFNIEDLPSVDDEGNVIDTPDISAVAADKTSQKESFEYLSTLLDSIGNDAKEYKIQSDDQGRITRMVKQENGFETIYNISYENGTVVISLSGYTQLSNGKPGRLTPHQYIYDTKNRLIREEKSINEEKTESGYVRQIGYSKDGSSIERTNYMQPELNDGIKSEEKRVNADGSYTISKFDADKNAVSVINYDSDGVEVNDNPEPSMPVGSSDITENPPVNESLENTNITENPEDEETPPAGETPVKSRERLGLTGSNEQIEETHEETSVSPKGISNLTSSGPEGETPVNEVPEDDDFNLDDLPPVDDEGNVIDPPAEEELLISEEYHFEADGKLYNTKNELYTGSAYGAYYKDGKLITGRYTITYNQNCEAETIEENENGLMYVNGIEAYGYYNEKYYRAGRPLTGTTIRKQKGGSMPEVVMCINGDIANYQTYQDKFYVDGHEAEKEIKADGKLYVNNTVVDNQVVDGILYTDGIITNNKWIEDTYYVNGIKANSTQENGYNYINGKLYIQDVLALGVINDILYKDGAPTSGESEGKYYYNGLLANGIIESKLYIDGLHIESFDELILNILNIQDELNTSLEVMNSYENEINKLISYLSAANNGKAEIEEELENNPDNLRYKRNLDVINNEINSFESDIQKLQEKYNLEETTYQNNITNLENAKNLLITEQINNENCKKIYNIDNTLYSGTIDAEIPDGDNVPEETPDIEVPEDDDFNLDDLPPVDDEGNVTPGINITNYDEDGFDSEGWNIDKTLRINQDKTSISFYNNGELIENVTMVKNDDNSWTKQFNLAGNVNIEFKGDKDSLIPANITEDENGITITAKGAEDNKLNITLSSANGRGQCPGKVFNLNTENVIVLNQISGSFSGGNNVTINGSDKDDFIINRAKYVNIYGGAGDDYLEIHGSYSYFDGQEGNDRVFMGSKYGFEWGDMEDSEFLIYKWNKPTQNLKQITSVPNVIYVQDNEECPTSMSFFDPETSQSVRVENPEHYRWQINDDNTISFVDENGKIRKTFRSDGKLINEYDEEGYNSAGWSSDVNNLINKITGNEYDENNYDRFGFDKNGWNKDGINKETGDLYDINNYDKDGYNREGWNIDETNLINKFTNSKYDENGFDRFGNENLYKTNENGEILFNGELINGIHNVDGTERFYKEGNPSDGWHADKYYENGYEANPNTYSIDVVEIIKADSDIAQWIEENGLQNTQYDEWGNITKFEVQDNMAGDYHFYKIEYLQDSYAITTKNFGWSSQQTSYYDMENNLTATKILTDETDSSFFEGIGENYAIYNEILKDAEGNTYSYSRHDNTKNIHIDGTYFENHPVAVTIPENTTVNQIGDKMLIETENENPHLYNLDGSKASGYSNGMYFENGDGYTGIHDNVVFCNGKRADGIYYVTQSNEVLTENDINSLLFGTATNQKSVESNIVNGWKDGKYYKDGVEANPNIYNINENNLAEALFKKTPCYSAIARWHVYATEVDAEGNETGRKVQCKPFDMKYDEWGNVSEFSMYLTDTEKITTNNVVICKVEYDENGCTISYNKSYHKDTETKLYIKASDNSVYKSESRQDLSISYHISAEVFRTNEYIDGVGSSENKYVFPDRNITLYGNFNLGLGMTNGMSENGDEIVLKWGPGGYSLGKWLHIPNNSTAAIIDNNFVITLEDGSKFGYDRSGSAFTGFIGDDYFENGHGFTGMHDNIYYSNGQKITGSYFISENNFCISENEIEKIINKANSTKPEETNKSEETILENPDWIDGKYYQNGAEANPNIYNFQTDNMESLIKSTLRSQDAGVYNLGTNISDLIWELDSEGNRTGNQIQNTPFDIKYDDWGNVIEFSMYKNDTSQTQNCKVEYTQNGYNISFERTDGYYKVFVDENNEPYKKALYKDISKASYWQQGYFVRTFEKDGNGFTEKGIYTDPEKNITIETPSDGIIQNSRYTPDYACLYPSKGILKFPKNSYVYYLKDSAGGVKIKLVLQDGTKQLYNADETKASGFVDGEYYENGELLIGEKNGELFVDEKLTNKDNYKLCVNGEIYDKNNYKLYSSGTLFSGNSDDGKLYENGTPLTGFKYDEETLLNTKFTLLELFNLLAGTEFTDANDLYRSATGGSKLKTYFSGHDSTDYSKLISEDDIRNALQKYNENTVEGSLVRLICKNDFFYKLANDNERFGRNNSIDFYEIVYAFTDRYREMNPNKEISINEIVNKVSEITGNENIKKEYFDNNRSLMGRTMYKDGEKANGPVDGVLYIDGQPVYGFATCDGKLYNDGKLFTGEYRNNYKLYKDGEPLNGIYSVQYDEDYNIVDFVKETNTENQGCLYKDGKLAEGLIDGKIYINGKEYQYGRDGYNAQGYDSDNYDKDGYDKEGYNRTGWNRDGINKYTNDIYNLGGYDVKGYNSQGWSLVGKNRETGTKYDIYGYDRYGFDENGWNADGIHKETGTRYYNGYDKDGYNEEGQYISSAGSSVEEDGLIYKDDELYTGDIESRIKTDSGYFYNINTYSNGVLTKTVEKTTTLENNLLLQTTTVYDENSNISTLISQEFDTANGTDYVKVEESRTYENGLVEKSVKAEYDSEGNVINKEVEQCFEYAKDDKGKLIKDENGNAVSLSYLHIVNGEANYEKFTGVVQNYFYESGALSSGYKFDDVSERVFLNGSAYSGTIKGISFDTGRYTGVTSDIQRILEYSGIDTASSISGINVVSESAETSNVTGAANSTGSVQSLSTTLKDMIKKSVQEKQLETTRPYYGIEDSLIDELMALLGTSELNGIQSTEGTGGVGSSEGAGGSGGGGGVDLSKIASKINFIGSLSNIMQGAFASDGHYAFIGPTVDAKIAYGENNINFVQDNVINECTNIITTIFNSMSNLGVKRVVDHYETDESTGKEYPVYKLEYTGSENSTANFRYNLNADGKISQIILNNNTTCTFSYDGDDISRISIQKGSSNFGINISANSVQHIAYNCTENNTHCYGSVDFSGGSVKSINSTYNAGNTTETITTTDGIGEIVSYTLDTVDNKGNKVSKIYNPEEMNMVRTTTSADGQTVSVATTFCVSKKEKPGVDSPYSTLFDSSYEEIYKTIDTTSHANGVTTTTEEKCIDIKEIDGKLTPLYHITTKTSSENSDTELVTKDFYEDGKVENKEIYYFSRNEENGAVTIARRRYYEEDGKTREYHSYIDSEKEEEKDVTKKDGEILEEKYTLNCYGTEPKNYTEYRVENGKVVYRRNELGNASDDSYSVIIEENGEVVYEYEKRKDGDTLTITCNDRGQEYNRFESPTTIYVNDNGQISEVFKTDNAKRKEEKVVQNNVMIYSYSEDKKTGSYEVWTADDGEGGSYNIIKHTVEPDTNKITHYEYKLLPDGKIDKSSENMYISMDGIVLGVMKNGEWSSYSAALNENGSGSLSKGIVNGSSSKSVTYNSSSQIISYTSINGEYVTKYSAHGNSETYSTPNALWVYENGNLKSYSSASLNVRCDDNGKIASFSTNSVSASYENGELVAVTYANDPEHGFQKINGEWYQYECFNPDSYMPIATPVKAKITPTAEVPEIPNPPQPRDDIDEPEIQEAEISSAPSVTLKTPPNREVSQKMQVDDETSIPEEPVVTNYTVPGAVSIEPYNPKYNYAEVPSDLKDFTIIPDATYYQAQKTALNIARQNLNNLIAMKDKYDENNISIPWLSGLTGVNSKIEDMTEKVQALEDAANKSPNEFAKAYKDLFGCYFTPNNFIEAQNLMTEITTKQSAIDYLKKFDTAAARYTALELELDNIFLTSPDLIGEKFDEVKGAVMSFAEMFGCSKEVYANSLKAEYSKLYGKDFDRETTENEQTMYYYSVLKDINKTDIYNEIARQKNALLTENQKTVAENKKLLKEMYGDFGGYDDIAERISSNQSLSNGAYTVCKTAVLLGSAVVGTACGGPLGGAIATGLTQTLLTGSELQDAQGNISDENFNKALFEGGMAALYAGTGALLGVGANSLSSLLLKRGWSSLNTALITNSGELLANAAASYGENLAFRGEASVWEELLGAGIGQAASVGMHVYLRGKTKQAAAELLKASDLEKTQARLSVLAKEGQYISDADLVAAKSMTDSEFLLIKKYGLNEDFGFCLSVKEQLQYVRSLPDELIETAKSLLRKMPTLNAKHVLKLLSGEKGYLFSKLDIDKFCSALQKGQLKDLCLPANNRAPLSADEHVSLTERTIDEINKMLNNEPIVKSSANEAMNGDCYIGSDGLLYLNDNGNPIEILMSKEKFEELFPPLISMNQNNSKKFLADCYLIAELDSLMDKSSGKARIYSWFEQVGNDIIVSIPGQKPITFKDGIVLDADGLQIQGSQKGLQMIEQAYAVNRVNSMRGTDISVVDSSLMDPFSGIDGIMYSLSADKSEFSKDTFNLFLDAVSSNHFKVDDATQFENWLIKATDDNIAITCNTHIGIGISERAANNILLAAKYGLSYGSGHANSVKSYDPINQIVYISDPFASSYEVAIPLEDFKQLVTKMYIMDISY